MITVSENSKDLVQRIFRRAFDECSQPWQVLSAKDVIRAAEEYNLDTDFINQLKNDL